MFNFLILRILVINLSLLGAVFGTILSSILGFVLGYFFLKKLDIYFGIKKHIYLFIIYFLHLVIYYSFKDKYWSLLLLILFFPYVKDIKEMVSDLRMKNSFL